MLSYHSDWSALFPLGDWANPWGDKVVCRVGMSEQRGGGKRGGGADCGFRWVQLHTTAKRSPCPTFAPRPKGVTPTTPSYPTHLCFQNASLGPSLAVGGTTNLLCPTTCRPAGNKIWEIIVHWLTRMSIHHQSTKHRENGLSHVHL